jgi:hypothetical protein
MDLRIGNYGKPLYIRQMENKVTKTAGKLIKKGDTKPCPLS